MFLQNNAMHLRVSTNIQHIIITQNVSPLTTTDSRTGMKASVQLQVHVYGLDMNMQIGFLET